MDCLRILTFVKTTEQHDENTYDLRLERQEDDVFICASKQKLDHTQTDPLSYRTIPRSSLHNLVHYIFTAHDFNRVEFTLRDSRTDMYMYVIDMLKRSTKTYS